MVDCTEIAEFVAAIGAKTPTPDSKDYAKWKATFKRSNYFLFHGKVIIVKISRSKKPFWGVGKPFIDLFNSLDDYHLVLLTSPTEGWLFCKSEVNAHIRSDRWKLCKADNNYKINFPLPDRNSFYSIKDFLTKSAVPSAT